MNGIFIKIVTVVGVMEWVCLVLWLEIAPEPTGHGLPLSKCEAYNRVYDQHYGSS
jgi:hypothetical protein